MKETRIQGYNVHHWLFVMLFYIHDTDYCPITHLNFHKHIKSQCKEVIIICLFGMSSWPLQAWKPGKLVYIYQSQFKLLISTHESFLGLAKNPHTESEVVQFFSIFLWFYQYRKKGKEKADRWEVYCNNTGKNLIFPQG